MEEEKVVNGVKCKVYEKFWPDGTRLLVPLSVDGLEFWEFAIFSNAENTRNPEQKAYEVAFWVSLYYSHCYKYLINKRRFELFYVSSPWYYPNVTQLFQLIKIEDSGSRYLDNVLRLVKLGKTLQGRSREEVLRRAIYRYPEWIPRIGPREHRQTVLRRELANITKELLRMIAEDDASLEEIQRHMDKRVFFLLTFLAEKTTFDIVDRTMRQIYRRIRSELTQKEKFCFRSLFFRNGDYLNRIIGYDPSPHFFSLSKIMHKLYLQLGRDKASRLFPLEKWVDLLIGGLNYYPAWQREMLDQEREKRWRARKRERLPKGHETSLSEAERKRREKRRRQRETSYEDWKGKEIVDHPDYMMNSFVEVLSRVGTSPAYDEGTSQVLGESQKEAEKQQEKPFLDDREREIIKLEAEGFSNKEIAHRMQLSASQTCKIRKAVRQKSQRSWEEGSHKPSMKNLYQKIKSRYDELPAEQQTAYKESHINFVLEAARRMAGEFGVDSEKIEKELIPPCFRK